MCVVPIDKGYCYTQGRVGRTMAISQRKMKFLLLMYMPLGVLAALGSFASFSVREISDVHFSQQSDAPGKTYRAYIAQVFSSQNCGRLSSSMVVIERRFGYLKTGEFVPFCFDGGPEAIQLSWTGPYDLTIACLHCEPGKIERYAGNWGALRLHYALPHASRPN
jgi:hypothetical protein